MDICFRTECLKEFLPDALPLLREHWKEVGSCPQLHALDVDTALYEAIERAGGLHITAAREGGGPDGPNWVGGLVGYAVYFVQHYPHVRDLCMAQSDALYLRPDFRKGFTGLRLLQAAEQALKAKGVRNIMQTCTVKKNFGALLRRMAYVNTETVYRKEV